MTTLTIPLLLLMVIAYWHRHGYLFVLAVAGATPAGAAIVVGSTAVPTFYAAALGVPVVLLARSLREAKWAHVVRAPFTSGEVSLYAFGLWTLIVTLTAPIFFAGVRYLSVQYGHQILAPGHLSSSNIAQIIYLVLSLMIVYYVKESHAPGVWVLGTAPILTVLLSFWDYLHVFAGAPFPTGFFDNSPTFNYIDQAAGGVYRFRGIMSEPAGLSGPCFVTIILAIACFRTASAAQRVGWSFLLIISMVMGIQSTSASFVVALSITSIIALIKVVSAPLQGKVFYQPASIFLGMGLFVAGIAAMPTILSFVTATIDTKLSSDSYTERSGSDSQAYALLRQTWGFGSGIGTFRGSSFLATMLGAVGVIGVALLAFGIYKLTKDGSKAEVCRPVVWVVVGSMVGKLISGPDLADPTGNLWIAMGIFAHYAIPANAEASNLALKARATALRDSLRPSRHRPGRPAGKAATRQPPTGAAGGGTTAKDPDRSPAR